MAKPHAQSAIRKISIYLANSLQQEITMDKLQVVGNNCARNTVSSIITQLTNAGWIITKPSNRSYMCHKVGTGKTNGRTKRNVSLQAFHSVIDQFDISDDVKVVPVETQPVKAEVVSPATSPNSSPINIGDLLEVVYVSRTQTIYAEDADGNAYTIKSFVTTGVA
jgi:hypothetical protein